MIFKAFLMIGITLVLCVGMIFLCTFLSGKSKNFIDKLSGNNKSDK